MVKAWSDLGHWVSEAAWHETTPYQWVWTQAAFEGELAGCERGDWRDTFLLLSQVLEISWFLLGFFGYFLELSESHTLGESMLRVLLRYVVLLVRSIVSN